jgi:hypothetical protein
MQDAADAVEFPYTCRVVYRLLYNRLQCENKFTSFTAMLGRDE